MSTKDQANLVLVRAYLEQALERLREQDVDELDEVRIEHCAEIEKERAKGLPDGKRYYAHVDHEPDVICFSDDVGKLAPPKQAGLVLHELGHLIADIAPTSPSRHEVEKAQEVYEAGRVEEEAEANTAIAEVLDVEILYGKDHVQRISQEDLEWLEETA